MIKTSGSGLLCYPRNFALSSNFPVGFAHVARYRISRPPEAAEKRDRVKEERGREIEINNEGRGRRPRELGRVDPPEMKTKRGGAAAAASCRSEIINSD